MDFRTYFDGLSFEEQNNILRGRCEKVVKGNLIHSLYSTLSNFDFLTEKISRIGIQPTVEDFNYLGDAQVTNSPQYDSDLTSILRVLQKALQQSANILEEDSTQFPSQLLSRLGGIDHPIINKLLYGNDDVRGAIGCTLYPWLQPMTVAHGSINQPFQTTIATDHDGNKVDAIAISGDGKWVLSARHNQVKLWDIRTGENKQSFHVSDFYLTEGESKLQTRRKLNSNITALSLSNNGRFAVMGFNVTSAPEDVLIEVWDLEEEKRLTVFKVAVNVSINYLAISENGRQIITGFKNSEFTISVLNEERTKALITVTLNDALFIEPLTTDGIVGLSPNGRWGVTNYKKFLLLWDFAKGRMVRSLPIREKGTIRSFSISNDGIIKALSSNGTLNVWNVGVSDSSDHASIERGLRKLERRKQIQDSDPRFLRDAFILLILAIRYYPPILGLLSKLSQYHWGKGFVSCILLQFQKPILYICHQIFYRSHVNYIDRNTIRLSDLKLLWGFLRIFSVQSPSKTSKLDLKGLNLPESITADGTIGISTTETDELQVIDLNAAQDKTTSTRQNTIIYEPWDRAIALSVDGQWVFSLVEGNRLAMWDVATREKYKTFKKRNLSSFWQRLITKKKYPLIPLNPDTKRNRIFVWLYHLLHRDLLLKDIDIVAKSLNGRWLFLISRNGFDVRDLGQDISASSASRWYLRNVSPNGQWGVWQSSTRTLRLTNLKTGQLAGMLHHYYGNLADKERWGTALSKNNKKWQQENWKYHRQIYTICNVSSDGKTVILYDNNSSDEWLWEPSQYLACWDVQAGDSCKILHAYQGPKYKAESGAKSHENKWVFKITSFVIFSTTRKAIFGLNEGTLKYCDLENQQEIFTLSGHKTAVTDVSLSPDEKWAVSCSLDQTIKVWSLPECQQIASFTTNSPLHTCKATHTANGKLIVIACDADKRTHIFDVMLPDNGESSFSEGTDDTLDAPAGQQELRQPIGYISAMDRWRAGETMREDSLEPDRMCLDRIGIPLPIHQLGNLRHRLHSEVGIDYHPLMDLLRDGKWPDANTETERLFCKVLGKENIRDINGKELRQFPNNDLLTIDRMWLKYSNGHYGFSIQMRIWEKSKEEKGLDFLRTIGRDAHDSRIPCEPMHERQGFFPFLSFLYDYKSAKKFFVRLAECFEYSFVTDDISDAEFNRILHENASSPMPSYSVEIADEDLQQMTLRDVSNFSSKEFYKYLDNLLKEHHWQEANVATKHRILSDSFDARQELKVIDTLWMLHSNNRFGFTIQERIWMQEEGNSKRFSDRVHWINEADTVSGNQLRVNFSLSAPFGHLPIFDFGKRGTVNDFSYLHLKTLFYNLGISSPGLITLPYPIILRGFPGNTAFLKIHPKTSGIIDVNFHLRGKIFYKKNVPYTSDTPYVIVIPLPSYIWTDSLIGTVSFKENSNDIIPSAFVSVKIICPVNNKNAEDYLKITQIYNDKTKIYQLLELQRNLLGDDHPYVILTLRDIIEQCDKIGASSDADFFRKEIENIKQQKIKQDIGFKNNGFSLFLSLEEWKQTHESGIG